jgi:hypothetical protein
MKITKSQLKQIIKEELSNIAEGGSMGHFARAAYERLSPEAKELWEQLEAIAAEEGWAHTVGAPHGYVKAMKDLGVSPRRGVGDEIMRLLEAMYGYD